MRTHYDTLQVGENASQELIETAFKAVSRQFSPERNPTQLDKAAEEMVQVAAAYRVLSNQKNRREYDAWLKGECGDLEFSDDDEEDFDYYPIDRAVAGEKGGHDPFARENKILMDGLEAADRERRQKSNATAFVAMIFLVGLFVIGGLIMFLPVPLNFIGLAVLAVAYFKFLPRM